VAPVSATRPPFWVWNAALSQLYMSSYHLAPELIPAYLDELARRRITYLWGYSSALHALAEGALRARRRDLQMRVAVTNAEPLTPEQRAAISEAFRCPVRETYGMAEIVAAAGECDAGLLHLWPEVGIVETRPDSAGAGRAELICTGLANPDMPLIRYRLGDCGGPVRWLDAPCACGRLLPVLETIEGRADDVVYTRDGRSIGRLDPVLKEALPVSEVQIVQERLDFFRVLYVPGEGFSAASAGAIVRRLRDRVGPVTVELEKVRQIPRGANGKMRAVVCKVAGQKKI
jgi:phenylacetate-CoA ligase